MSCLLVNWSLSGGLEDVSLVCSLVKELIPFTSQDTAGSERYEAMSRIYYRGAKAAIVCYGKGLESGLFK